MGRPPLKSDPAAGSHMSFWFSGSPLLHAFNCSIHVSLSSPSASCLCRFLSSQFLFPSIKRLHEGMQQKQQHSAEAGRPFACRESSSSSSLSHSCSRHRTQVMMSCGSSSSLTHSSLSHNLSHGLESGFQSCLSSARLAPHQ